MTENGNYYQLSAQLVSKSIEAMVNGDDSLVENDQSKIVESISFTERLFPKVVLLLSPFTHKQVYISETCNEILGLSREYLKSLTPGEFIKLIHPEDIRGHSSCLEYVLNKKINLRDDYRITFYYRVINSAGETVYIEDERVALKNEYGRYIHLALLKNITYEESFSGTKVKISKRIKDKYLLLHEYFPKLEANELTSRQRDIIQLVLMGLSNQEIANRLSLSIYTIKNHKQALFKKFGIGTSLELTSLVKGVNRNNLSKLFTKDFSANLL